MLTAWHFEKKARDACSRCDAKLKLTVCCSALLGMLYGCSGSSAPAAPTDVPDAALVLSDPAETVPRSLLALSQRTDLLAPVPQVFGTQTLANSGLQVSYTQSGLWQSAPPSSIDEQWMMMLDCVQQIAPSPLVLVRHDAISPFAREDDVVRNIESLPIASASTLVEPVVQVSILDFDGSQGRAGFYLRSILARYLWFASGLAERDYPFECARDTPD